MIEFRGVLGVVGVLENTTENRKQKKKNSGIREKEQG
jgi:hypothetical protein